MDGTLNKIAKTIKDGLPHAFDYKYWTMADTTYKEELALSIIESFKLNIKEANSFLRKCGILKTQQPIIYLYLSGDLDEGMGIYSGKTDKGKKIMKKINGYD